MNLAEALNVAIPELPVQVARRGRPAKVAPDLIVREIRDPRIGLVSVTSVHVADDGRSAEVWVNVEGDDAEADRSIEGLEAAREYIRHELVERLRIRRAPELYFRLDRAEQAKARVDELLERAKRRSRARKESSGEQA